MSVDPALSAALADVRKAYRLLWSYQRRLLDTIGLIAGEFPGVSFASWQPMDFYPPARKSVNPADYWASDLLPLMGADFFYLRHGNDRSMAQRGEWMLVINVTSDSGYEVESPEPDPARFEPAEECESSLELYIVKSTGDVPVRWTDGLWDRMEWPDDFPASILMESPALRAFGMKFDIAELGTSDAVIAAVANFKASAAADLQLDFTA